MQWWRRKGGERRKRGGEESVDRGERAKREAEFAGAPQESLKGREQRREELKNARKMCFN